MGSRLWWGLGVVGLLIGAQPAWGQEKAPIEQPADVDRWVLDRIRTKLEQEGWTVLHLAAFRTNRGIVFGFGGLLDTPQGKRVVAGTYHQLTGRVTIDRFEPVPP